MGRKGHRPPYEMLTEEIENESGWCTGKCDKCKLLVCVMETQTTESSDV